MKLLVVDQDLDSVEFMRTHTDWKSLNIDQITVAQSVQDAKEKIEEACPDIVFCEIDMTEEDSFIFIDWLNKRNSSVIKMFLTTCQDFETARKVMQSGVDGYLLKPLDVKEFSNIMCNSRIREKLSYHRINEIPSQLWINQKNF